MGWITFSPSCHFTNYTYNLRMCSVVWYFEWPKPATAAFSVKSLFCSALWYQTVPFCYVYKLFRWICQKRLHQTYNMLVKKEQLSKLFLFHLLNPDLQPILNIFTYFLYFKKMEMSFILQNEFLVTLSEEFLYEFWWKLGYFCKTPLVLHNVEWFLE